MKTSILLTVIMVTVTSFGFYYSESDAKETIGLQVITALQRSSVHEFSALFPTVADFHALMVSNAELYGENLGEAAREFEKEFELVLYPQFQRAFETILREGKAAGIDWRTIELVSVEVPDAKKAEFTSGPMTITFDAQGKTHKLQVEKALLINGDWKLSQYMHLEK